MTHRRKSATPSNPTTMRVLEANELRQVHGGETELTTSNVLKTRHDTVKNTIGNIR